MNELTIYEEDRLTLTDYAAEEITKIEIALKDLKRKKDEITKALLEEMTKNDVISIEHEAFGLSIKKVEAYDRETLDSKLLRKDHPDIYDEYVKISPVKPSVRISIKG